MKQKSRLYVYSALVFYLRNIFFYFLSCVLECVCFAFILVKHSSFSLSLLKMAVYCFFRVILWFLFSFALVEMKTVTTRNLQKKKKKAAQRTFAQCSRQSHTMRAHTHCSMFMFIENCITSEWSLMGDDFWAPRDHKMVKWRIVSTVLFTYFTISIVDFVFFYVIRCALYSSPFRSFVELLRVFFADCRRQCFSLGR